MNTNMPFIVAILIMIIICIMLVATGCSSDPYYVVWNGRTEQVDAQFKTKSEAQDYVSEYGKYHDYKIVYNQFGLK